jgi:hypothetical protein
MSSCAEKNRIAGTRSLPSNRPLGASWLSAIDHFFRDGQFWAFSPRKAVPDKKSCEMFDFFIIFARQIIRSLGTPNDALLQLTPLNQGV